MNQISLKKKEKCCSYCGTPGHKINKCNGPAIQKLIEEAEEACIVSYAFYWVWNPKKTLDTCECVQKWLKEISPNKLKVLAYHFKIDQDKKTSIDLLPNALYSKWITPCNQLSINSKMIFFSDEKLKKWQEFLCEKYHLTPENVGNRIWELCYPNQKFFIDAKHCEPFASTESECPICFSNLTSENTIRTGCNHDFCKQCATQYMRATALNKDELSCPMCRDIIKKMSTPEKETFDILSIRYCNTEHTPEKISDTNTMSNQNISTRTRSLGQKKNL
jgi:hypothetical protein